MSRVFAKSGIRLSYPDGWSLESEEREDGWTASIFSPATAFILLSYHAGEDDPAALADLTLEEMRKEYPDLESETNLESIAGTPALGYDVEFFALDLTNTCWIRTIPVEEGCLLLMSQCTDEELPSHGPMLRAITESLMIEDED